jgi:hypothetical protein
MKITQSRRGWREKFPPESNTDLSGIVWYKFERIDLMSSKKSNKPAREDKTTEAQRIQSAVNSQYYCMIPHLEAEYVTLRNPITGLDHHFKSDSEKFLEMVWDLCQRGMKEKILRDLQTFSELFDSRWEKVIDLVTGYVRAKETQNVG